MPNLYPHPAQRRPPITRVSVGVEISDAGALLLDCRIEGDLGALVVPEPKDPERMDFLWQHTCFEAFVATDGTQAYHELNLSPSGDWAIYGFRAYREVESIGMDGSVLDIHAQATADRLQVEARIDIPSLSEAYRGASLRLGFFAVLEEVDGTLSYWSLRHVGDRADFHDASGFTYRVPRGAYLR